MNQKRKKRVLGLIGLLLLSGCGRPRTVRQYKDAATNNLVVGSICGAGSAGILGTAGVVTTSAVGLLNYFMIWVPVAGGLLAIASYLIARGIEFHQEANRLEVEQTTMPQGSAVQQAL